MHHHLRTIVKERNEKFFILTLIERFLVKIKKEHDIFKIKDLEKHLISEVKKDIGDKHLKHQLDFLKIVEEFIKAFDLANNAHEGQKRKDGEPYIVHPVSVCLNEIYHQENETHVFNEDTIVAALLHDTVEDTNTHYDDIHDEFGDKMANIIDNLTDDPIWSKWHKEGHLSVLEESALQFCNASKSIDSLDVKFADRLNNLETIAVMPEDKIVQKIMDTISVGFIEKAEELEEWHFLEVLGKIIKKYLTNDIIKKYFRNDPAIIRLINKARQKIEKMLNR